MFGDPNDIGKLLPPPPPQPPPRQVQEAQAAQAPDALAPQGPLAPGATFSAGTGAEDEALREYAHGLPDEAPPAAPRQPLPAPLRAGVEATKLYAPAVARVADTARGLMALPGQLHEAADIYTATGDMGPMIEPSLSTAGLVVGGASPFSLGREGATLGVAGGRLARPREPLAPQGPLEFWGGEGVPEYSGSTTARLAPVQERGNQHGLNPQYRVRVEGLQETGQGALILSGTKNANADWQLANLDTIHAHYPNAGSDPTQWGAMMSHALGTKEVPMPPYAFMKDLAGDAAGAVAKIKGLSPEQIAQADHGFENAQQFRKAYEAGEVSPVVTGQLFLWSILSRMKSPYIQESAFLDAAPGSGKWILKAVEGRFTEKDLPGYLKWAEGVSGGKGSGLPGVGSSENINAFGTMFLLKMSETDGTGKSRLLRMHEMLSNPNMTGKQIRREFAKMSEGVGIDNKVMSFTLLVTGHNDVLVLDRVQMKQLWNDGMFGDPKKTNIYDPRIDKKTKKPIAGSGIASLGDGVRGILIYETLERALEQKIHDIYAAAGRPQVASPGRYHWESWVSFSGQEASHGTIGALLDYTHGTPMRQAISRVTASEGKFNTYAYGARYGKDARGKEYFRYETPDKNVYYFTTPAWRAFLGKLSNPRSGVVPKGFKIQDKDNVYEGIPWYRRPDVNPDAIEPLAREHADLRAR